MDKFIQYLLMALFSVFLFGFGVSGTKGVPDSVLVLGDIKSGTFIFAPCVADWVAKKDKKPEDFDKAIDTGQILMITLKEARIKNWSLDERCRNQGYGIGEWRPLLFVWLEDMGLKKRSPEWWER